MQQQKFHAISAELSTRMLRYFIKSILHLIMFVFGWRMRIHNSNIAHRPQRAKYHILSWTDSNFVTPDPRRFIKRPFKKCSSSYCYWMWNFEDEVQDFLLPVIITPVRISQPLGNVVGLISGTTFTTRALESLLSRHLTGLRWPKSQLTENIPLY